MKVWVALDVEEATLVGVAYTADLAKAEAEKDNGSDPPLTWREKSDGRFTAEPGDYPIYRVQSFEVIGVTTFEEWRVTGDPGEGFPPYDFTWSPFRNPHLGDPEVGARGFVALIESVSDWADGPHLSRRTVTVTDWEAL